MIWGVGTGRCGTKSLALQLGGVHEPEPWLGELPARAARGLASPQETMDLMEQLLRRKQLDVPIVVDLHQTYVMDLIEQVDEDAMFVGLIRNPFLCVTSFLAGGAWTEQDDYGAKKLAPAEGWSMADDRWWQATWYWKETNRRMLSHFERSRRPSILVPTQYLQVHAQKYAASEEEVLPRGPAGYVLDECHDIYQWAQEYITHRNPEDLYWFDEEIKRALLLT